MLWNASAIKGYSVRTFDGHIGTVADLRFQDFDWTITWLEIDTGDWLPGRRVLLPVAALGQPDPDSREFMVKLTTRQVEESPSPDMTVPLSPESEALLLGHYDLPHRRDRHIWGSPDAVAAPAQSAAQRLGIADPPGHENHIHSLAGVGGNSIEATDGDIGHAEDFLVDTATWQIRYVTVHTSNWWVGEKVLISPRSVDWIDWARGIIHLDVSRQKVMDSPPYVAAQTVDGAFDALFDTYYGIRLVKR